jgi:WD40 repeat protein
LKDEKIYQNFSVFFFPKDLSKLISEYDYNIVGRSHDIKLDNILWSFLTSLSDSRLIVIICNTINIWNLQTGKWDIFQTVDFGITCINCIVKLPDDRIVVGLNNGFIKRWNPQTGDYDLIIKGHTDAIYYVDTFHNEQNELRLVSASFDDTVKIWDLTNINHETIVMNTNQPTCDLFSVLSDGRLLFRTGDNGVFKIKMWNLQHKNYDIIVEIESYVFCHCLLSGGRIVTGLNNGDIKIWDTSTMFEIKTLVGHSDGVECIAVLPDGRLISASADKRIKIWNLQTEKCDMTLNGHSDYDRIRCIVVLPDGRIISASGFVDEIIKIWS